ncbi:MAG: chromate transporter [Chitinophagaceae bacterium]|nr:chromate transporter [Chitinophagaceae bacterium]
MPLSKHLPFFRAVLLYTLSAFGGPQGQLGMMIKSFVDKNDYISLKDLININAFCQLMPGATATQTISLIGYRQGGFFVAVITLLIWTTPAVLFMSALSFVFSSNNLTLLQHLRFIQPMALGFLAFASIRTYAMVDTKQKWFIVFVSSVVTYLLFKTPWVFPIVLCFGGFMGFTLKSGSSVKRVIAKRLRFLPIVLFALFFLLAGFLSETARKQSWENRTPYNVFENMYRFGSMVFGGADVLIPVMYNQYVVRPTTERIKRTNKDVISIDRDVFLSASGVVRAIPGPAFSISAFIGGMAMNDRGWSYQLLGCFLAATGIFLPTFLLVIFFYPFWENIQQYSRVQNIMSGVNAAVVGIMTASIIYLFKDTVIPFVDKPIIDTILFFSVFCTTFFLLYHTRIAAPLIALGCLLLGFL